MSTKIVIVIEIAVGVLFLAVMALLVRSGAMGATEGVTLAATIAVFIPLYYLLVQRRRSRLGPDERTRRIDSRAITWSWLLTLSFLCVLLSVDSFTEAPFTANGVILYVLLFMISSRWIVYFILSRRGDVAEW